MSAFSSAPGRQERRFVAYLDSLAQATEHADRVEPFKSYCTGLLLPGQRKSVEPMAARLAPGNVRQTHESRITWSRMLLGVTKLYCSKCGSRSFADGTKGTGDRLDRG